MADFSGWLRAGDVVHLWMRPIDGADVASLAITLADQTHRLVIEGPTRNPLPLAWNNPADGEARFAWPERTEVSLAYAFASASVAKTGIRVLWTSEATRLSGARHLLHFSPPFGWMNDPNGLCEIDGVTHLFYQHNPHGRRWNTMHWGHAISHDGLRWLHQPVALLPRQALVRGHDSQGGAYSGSARRGSADTIQIYYTDRDDNRRPTREWQMVTALEHGWRPEASRVLLDTRPPLPGFGQDWRDPFVFDGPDGRRKMLLGGADAQGSLVLLYETDDREGINGWRFVDVVIREPSRRSVPAECPCIIRLDGADDVWVMIFGLIGSRDPVTRRRNLTRTYIGRFDGRQFESLLEHELDFGADCYAMQVWRGSDGPRGIAWAANWTDVFADRDFESAMTLPRRLLWRHGQLLTPPIAAVDGLRCGPPRLLEAAATFALTDGLAEIALELSPDATFALEFGQPTHAMTLTYDGDVLELHCAPVGGVPRYHASCGGMQTLRVFVDVGLIEIFADGGRACCTKRIDSSLPIGTVRLVGNAGVASAKLWPLRRPTTRRDE